MTTTMHLTAWACLCGPVLGMMASTALAGEPATPAPTANRPVRVACVGDSLTSGFQMAKPEQDAYPAQLGRLLGTNWEVRAFAVPGRTALRKADLALWKEKVFADAQAWQPDVVVLCLGTNDSWPATWQKLGGEFTGDLRAMVDLFAKLPSHPRIWLCVPPPFFIEHGEVQQRIMTQEINPAVRAVAKESGCAVIDWYAALAGHPELFMADKVHPLPGAAAVMAKAVADSLGQPAERRAGSQTSPDSSGKTHD